MTQHSYRHTDDRFNALSDRDNFWGPLIGFRPEKTRCISVARALAITGMLGAFYGMLLNFSLVLLWRHTSYHVPPVYVMPALLTLTYFVMFQITLGPAWNRRARQLARRAGYIASVRNPQSER